MFAIRTTKPGADNKHYIRISSGGYNSCVKGKPTDKDCDVLANCVGYANGRFNEIIAELTGFKGNKYNTLNCNAENFIERAKKAGLETGLEPKPGAIIVWQKGETLSGDDGAGHVAVVEKVIDKNTIYTSESGYGSSAFWNTKRTNTNGRWGISSKYKFREFIYNPAVKEEKKPEPKPEPPKPEPKPEPKLKVGDKVKIIGKGNGSSYGDSNTAGGIGWERYITKIYEGRPFPYQVGNKGKTDSLNTTGFYAESALKKL